MEGGEEPSPGAARDISAEHAEFMGSEADRPDMVNRASES